MSNISGKTLGKEYLKRVQDYLARTEALPACISRRHVEHYGYAPREVCTIESRFQFQTEQ